MPPTSHVPQLPSLSLPTGGVDPVTASRRLAPIQPKFLLESSTACRTALGRYSSVGLGEALRLELRDDALLLAGNRSRAPTTRAGPLDVFRAAPTKAPLLGPDPPGVRLPGGLVGFGSYEDAGRAYILSGASLLE